ncbi:MAG TPA: hypothetical protein VHZ54_08875 [Solirubrobacterales bacterium]|nr:hypothetical protein [Solirubrobacterales bacterium]
MRRRGCATGAILVATPAVRAFCPRCDSGPFTLGVKIGGGTR